MITTEDTRALREAEKAGRELLSATLDIWAERNGLQALAMQLQQRLEQAEQRAAAGAEDTARLDWCERAVSAYRGEVVDVIATDMRKRIDVSMADKSLCIAIDAARAVKGVK